MWKLFPKSLMMVLAFLLIGAVNLFAQTITVLSPNGGEIFKQNVQQIVAWKSSGVTGNVNIKLSTDGGTTFGVTVASNIPAAQCVYGFNTGSYTATNLRIKVESATNPAVSDASNANFTISGASLVYLEQPFVISDGATSIALSYGLDPTATNGIDATLGEAELPPMPPSGVFDGRWVDTTGTTNLGQGVAKDFRQGGSTFIGPKIHSVKYQMGSGDSMRIYWSLPAYITGKVQDMLGGILVNINISGTGYYTIPNALLSQLRVQFNYAAAPASITVVSPNGGETWIAGSQQNIVWNQSGVTTVKLEYTTNNGTSWVLIGTAPALTASKVKLEGYHPKDPRSNLFGTLGTYSWTVPNTPSANCKVKVSDNTNATVFDESNSTFTISSTPPPSENWTVQTSGTTSTLYAVDVVDQNVAWVGGAAGVVLRTTNGGTNWSTVTAPSADDVYALVGIDANNALLTTSPASGTLIFKTTNGGSSWTQVYSQTGGFLDGLHMFDANNGYAYGDPVGGNWTLLKTTNGGSSWTSAATLAQTGTEAGWNNALEFVGQTGYFGTNVAKVYKTTDGGATWAATTTTAANTYELGFATANIGITGIAGGVVNKTTNAGTNWTAATSPATGSITGATAIGVDNYFVTSGSNVYGTTNFGTTWTTSHAGTSALYHVDAKGDLNLAYGYAVGATGRIVKYFRGTQSPTIAIVAPNGGENWTIGSQRTIQWSATSITTVKIEYTTNNGTSWNLIGTAPALASKMSNHSDAEYQSDDVTGSYVWTVPNTPSTQCKVRVSDNSNATINSVSASTFTISTATPGPTLQFSYDVNALSAGALALYGAEFDGTNFWVSRWSTSFGPSHLFKIAKNGTSILDSFAVTGFPAASGFRDLAFDGQYLYGAPNSTTIYKVDPVTKTVVGTITAPQSVRGIAYDKARNGLWIANWTTNIQLISMTGTVLQTITTATHQLASMSGLAYDTLSAGGPYIWAFCDGVDVDPSKLVKINATTGVRVDSFDITNDLPAGAIGGGLFITNQFQAGTTTLGGLNQGTPHKLFGYQIGGSVQPFVQVVSPNGGENWVVGSQHNISWNQSGVTTVKLEYTTNNGTSWILIGTAPALTTNKIVKEGYNPKDPDGILTGTLGTYLWTIPNTLSTQCKVRVSDNTNATLNDVSDNTFSIIDVPPPSESWTVQTSGSTATLYAVDVVDQNVAWVGGTAGVVLRTTNGGTNWTTVTAPAAEDVYALVGIDANNALVTTSPSSGTFIYKTTNGGSSWAQVYSQTGGFLDGLHMFDANNGFAYGDPVGGNWTLLKTTNGGSTWTSAATLAQVGTEAGWNNALEFVGQTGYFGTNNSKIYKTTNGGANWTATTTTAVNSYEIAFESATVGLAGFATGVANATTNGGTNWTAVTTPATGNITGFANIGAGTYFFTSGSNVYGTTNAGTSWTTSYAGTAALYHVDLKGDLTTAYGYAVGATGRIVKYFRGSVAPSITVVAPNGGEQWSVGSQRTIQWSATSISTVKLEYTTNNGTSWILIGTAPALFNRKLDNTAETSNLTDDITGTYTWTVPNTISSQCKVRVSDNSNPTLFDVSDNTFSIVSATPGPTLQFKYNVTTLAPGAVALYGSEFDGNYFYITRWSTSFGPSHIFRIAKNGTSIVDSFAVTGFPAASGFRDLAWDGQFMYGAPNSTTIYKWDPTTKTVVGTITAPQSVRGIAYDKARNGLWITNWASNIQLISMTGTVIQTIPAATHGLTGVSGLAYDTLSDGGPYLWALNDGVDVDPTILYKLNATTGARVDSLDITAEMPTGAIGGGLFVTQEYEAGTLTLGGSNQGQPHYIWGYKIKTLGPPPSTITMITPKGGESFKPGALTIVAWKSGNYTGTVNIKLSSDGGATYPTTIATNVPDNGVYSFNLPTALGTNYKVKVEASGQPAVFGASGAFSVVTGTLMSVDLPIVIYDGTNLRYLRFGLHPTATDTIDATLGEEELPPVPPTNVFDGRWIGSEINLPKLGQGILLDYRQGQNQAPAIKAHELFFQKGANSPGITIFYAMPNGVTCRLQDTFTDFDSTVVGTGKFDVANTALTKLKVSPTYFQKTVTVVAPNGGEVLFAGRTFNIQWTGSGITTYKLEYSTNGGTSFVHIGYATGTSYAWTVPTTLTTQGRIKVADSVVPAIVYDMSNANFSIVPSAPGAFNLIQPANNTRIVAREGNPTKVVVKWSKAQYGNTYQWRAGAPIMTPAFISIASDNGGLDTVLTLDEAKIYDDMVAVGVVDSVVAKWAVWAFNPMKDDSTKSAQEFTIKIVLQKLTGVKDKTGVPTTFDIAQNYPNPFNPTTKIEYQIPKETHVSIEIFNLVGQKVATLVNQTQKAGYYDINFDAKNINSGVYIYRIKAGDFTSVKKMILMK